jgi:hypothetical protein
LLSFFHKAENDMAMAVSDCLGFNRLPGTQFGNKINYQNVLLSGGYAIVRPILAPPPTLDCRSPST